MARCERHQPHPQKRHQRGDALLESLIAMLLLTIICLGLVLALGRSMTAQKYQKATSLAVQGIRGALQSNGVASGCPSSGSATAAATLSLTSGPATDSVQKTCTVAAVTVSINGVAKTAKLPVVTYSVQAQTLMGPGTLTVSN